MDSSSSILLGKSLTLISFIGEVIFMVLFYLIRSESVASAGIIFVVVIGATSLIVFGHLVYHYFKDIVNRRQILKTAAVMLLNIPVLLVYYDFALGFLFRTF